MTKHEINQLIHIKQDIDYLLFKLERCERTATNLDVKGVYIECVN
jgi:hypothetical protein